MNQREDLRSAAQPAADSVRPESLSPEEKFGGKLKALSFCDLLEFLRVLNRNGKLTVWDESREVSIQVREGKVRSVNANTELGRLPHFLLEEGELTRDQHEAVLERERNGERANRALVELGILSPKEMWASLRKQCRALILDLFEWDQGEFRFEECSDSGTGLEAELPIQDLVADGIRSVKTLRLFEERMPSGTSVLERIPDSEGKTHLPLEPHERYVLGLIDGSRNLEEIIRVSEIGRLETLRVMFLLFSVGYLKMLSAASEEDFLQEQAPDDALPLIRRYNEMFGFLYQYLVREVGPIGEAVLERYFDEQRRVQSSLLSKGRLGKDGTLDEDVLLGNLDSMGSSGQIEHLVDGLNELLYAELLALRRTLGPAHEGRAVQGLREMGLQPVTQIQTATDTLDRD